MKAWTIALLLVLLMVLPATTSLASAAGTVRQEVHHYKWVVMVYMDADNNLEDAGIGDFNEMEVAGSTDDVAIVVLMDRIPGYDTTNGNWTDARIYLVQHDTDTQTINSKLLEDLGEVNMGDPNTVLYFVNYTVSNFSADHYMLVFWDHGSGWKRSDGGIPVKGCCWDYTNGDHLTQKEIKYVMETLSQMGIHLDIVGFDACLMQMIDVAYDLIGTADIVIASEEFEPWDGWYYTGFLVPLVLNASMTPAELAAKVVESYGDFYTNEEPLSWTTLSAVNLTKLADVVNDLDEMAKWLTYDVYFYPSNASAITAAREKALKFGDGDYIDLYGFAAAINGTEGFPYDPRPAAARLLEDLNASVIANYAGADEVGAHGISIYFPPDVDWYLEERYWYLDQVDLAFNTWWGWFLDYYFRTMKPTEHLSIKVVAPPVVPAGSNVTVYILATYGKASIYVDYMEVTLVSPNGVAVPVAAVPVMEGVYVANLTVPDGVSAAYLVRAEAEYWFLSSSDGSILYASSELGSIPAISHEVDVLKALVEEYGASLESLSGDVAVIKTTVGSINVSVSDLKSLLEEYGAYIEEIKGDVAVIKTGIGVINASLSDLKPVIADIKNGVVTVKTRLGVLEASLDTVKAEVESLSGDVATVKTLLGTVNVSVSQLKPEILKIEDGVATIKTVLGTLKGTVESLSGDVATVKTDVGSIKVTLSNVKAAQEKGFGDVKSTVEGLSSRVSQLESNVSTLSEKLDSQARMINATLALVVIVLIVALIGAYGAFKRP